MEANNATTVRDRVKFYEANGGVKMKQNPDTMMQQLNHHQHHSNHHQPQGPARMTENGLILPRKLHNPCLESKEVQEINREIKWNARTGINVLGTKSELEKAMEKRKLMKIEQDRKLESQAMKTDFQKVLEQRAKKLDDLEKTNKEKAEEDRDSGHCSPEPEFVKVHAQLRGISSRRSPKFNGI